ncbi:TetR family transcriptional regulator [Streptomyces sp. NBC_00237]|uniref:TetR/AcrR family transcriptional regulator n=1 Tax=Streptomyces sp. NBC_00237 TaxID=2975687 RepID=UPI00225A8C48|nr:TetR/AcrR family transcriptional regulator [Streptomyces sp. NBC_00237]MCX5205200.1 TetR family transcriptional regulator [Streptomyces sp. NBC_00237]
MTPARGDHEARRADVSRAVWQVLAERGFGGLTLRAVAQEMGATTGLLTHYFPSKRALLQHALEVLDKRSLDRPRPAAGRAGAGTGLVMLRAVLLDILPLDAEGAASNRIWVGSWDVALADPELAAEHAQRYRRSRERIAVHVRAAQESGELPRGPVAEDVAAAAQGFVLGLVVQALFAPDEFTPERQVALVDQYLESVAGGS